MITKSNLKNVLNCIGFEKRANDKMDIHFESSDCTVTVDFKNEKIIYPDGIEADRDTTKNFSANENFVVLECVVKLLKQGYKPENIVLEPKTPGGRENSNFYCDILVRDNDKRAYMLIECKTADNKESDEFNQAWRIALRDGGQLFNYYNTYRRAEYLVLYASDFVDGELKTQYRLITMKDNKDYLELNQKLRSYEQVRNDNGTIADYFKVWSETYGKDFATNGAFEDDVPAFGVSKKKLTVDDLVIVNNQDIQRKYHQFAQTLRQYNVASHENAFDKLVNLFLVKVVDEVRNPKDLQFLWKGAAYDDYYSFQDRLQQLYQIGMKEYLGEEVTYIDNSSIENAFRMQRNDPDAIKDTIIEYFRQLKFYSNSDFGFLDVHNKQLFIQNSIILKAMVEMLQDMRLKTEEQNQFLGDLFEGFLDQGVKQNEGQFFTPIPIVRFMTSSLPIEQIIRDNTDIPKAIDYACGAGHFLNEYAIQIKPFVEKYKGAEALSDYYKQIYGIEKEYRLSKVSKVSSFMYGQDGIQVVYGDALVSHKQIKEGEYKVLVANPPYSVTGFLDTLTKEERDAFVLSAEVDSKQYATNNSIEAFFIERAKQILAPGGVAAIILPSSFLSNNNNLYVKTREIILQYFDIVAISEFGGKTFGKTDTSTIILFLRRKKSEPEIAEHYRNRVDAWFSGNHEQDERFEDFDVIERYTKHIGVIYEDYLTLLEGKMSENLMSSEIFSAYQETFSNDTNAKALKRKRITKQYTQEKKDEELAKYIFNSICKIEKEKLYYFMLCESNPQSVIVVKSPNDKTANKKFLGYEWSNRKGSEGIKYLGAVVDDEDNDISANKGIQQIKTPLFDPTNLFNKEKINTLIRNNYLGEDIDIPDSLNKFVNVYSLLDLIEFSNIKFEKSIFTSIRVSVEIKSKYKSKYIKKIFNQIESGSRPSGGVDMYESGALSLGGEHIHNTNGLLNLTSVKYVPESFYNSASSGKLKKNDILICKDGARTGKIAIIKDELEGKHAMINEHVFLLRSGDEICQKYVYCILSTNEGQDVLKSRITGSAQKGLNSTNLKMIKIPFPPKNIQEKIVKECSEIEKKYFNSTLVDEYISKKQAILDKYLK